MEERRRSAPHQKDPHIPSGSAKGPTSEKSRGTSHPAAVRDLLVSRSVYISVRPGPSFVIRPDGQVFQGPALPYCSVSPSAFLLSIVPSQLPVALFIFCSPSLSLSLFFSSLKYIPFSFLLLLLLLSLILLLSSRFSVHLPGFIFLPLLF